MLGATLRDVPLITNTRVNFLPKESPNHLMMEKSVLVDEKDDAQEAKGEGLRALKRRKR